jgi:hypothetical protein
MIDTLLDNIYIQLFFFVAIMNMSNAVSFSRLYLFCLSSSCVLCTQMVPVSLDCLSSVCLRHVSCVPNGSSFSRLSLFCFSSSCVLYKTEDEDKQNKDNLEKLEPLGTQDRRRRQTEQRQSRETGTIGYTRHIHVSCVPKWCQFL